MFCPCARAHLGSPELLLTCRTFPCRWCANGRAHADALRERRRFERCGSMSRFALRPKPQLPRACPHARRAALGISPLRHHRRVSLGSSQTMPHDPGHVWLSGLACDASMLWNDARTPRTRRRPPRTCRALLPPSSCAHASLIDAGVGAQAAALTSARDLALTSGALARARIVRPGRPAPLQ